jgi:pilus assembly protein Flp/PilA
MAISEKTNATILKSSTSSRGGPPMNFLTGLYVRFQTMVKSEEGQTLVEYALLLLLIAIVVILMVKGLGGTTNNVFSKTNSALQ